MEQRLPASHPESGLTPLSLACAHPSLPATGQGVGLAGGLAPAMGLYESYGAAQRLYAMRGYLPDGRGVTYRNEVVEPGSEVRLDDDLLLHLTKRLARGFRLPATS